MEAVTPLVPTSFKVPKWFFFSHYKLINACGERTLACVVQSNRRAAVAQTAKKGHTGSDRKVSAHTMHCSLLRMGLHSCRPVRVHMLTRVHTQKHLQWIHQNWTMGEWKRVACSDAFKNSLRNTMSLKFSPGRQISICGMCCKNKVRSMEAPPYNLKDLLLMAWYQIPQHTIRGLVGSMPWKGYNGWSYCYGWPEYNTLGIAVVYNGVKLICSSFNWN